MEDPLGDDITEDFAFSLTSLAAAQEAVERAGISPHKLRDELANSDLLVFNLEEMVEELGDT